MLWISGAILAGVTMWPRRSRVQRRGVRRKPSTSQSYSPELIQAGAIAVWFAVWFLSRTGILPEGRTGPDLTRSTLVAEDVRGDKIGPLVRAGPRR
jgi:hypothetical protein